MEVNGHLPLARSAEEGLYSWLYRNLRRLERLPQELVEQLRDSHPLIGARVRVAQVKHVAGARLKGSSQGAAKYRSSKDAVN